MVVTNAYKNNFRYAPIILISITYHSKKGRANIPVYNDRHMTIVFNILPLGDNLHKLFIDIYSAIVFPKPILQILLHAASYLTLFEDMSYLRELAECNLYHRVSKMVVSDREPMQLFKRFVDLYGCSLDRPGSSQTNDLGSLVST